MLCLKSLLVGLGGLAVGVFFWSLGVATAQQAPQYPQDDKLANEPAPWTVPGKWGKRGNWGRWGENDKRGMLNYITPDMIVKAAGLVKQGKVYALGEELHADVPRVITPQRMGIQIMQDRDGYDRVAAQSGAFDPNRYQVGASFTFMHNTATRRASSSWPGVASCSMSPGTRALTLSLSITGSPWMISRTPRRRKTWRSERATSCWSGRAGGRRGMNPIPPGVSMPRTPSGINHNQGSGPIV